jgi:hypothetical protein
MKSPAMFFICSRLASYERFRRRPVRLALSLDDKQPQESHMLTRLFATASVAAALLASPALAQSPQVAETVTLNSFDHASGPYTGWVHFQAQPCASGPLIAFNVNVSGVKDQKEALAQVKDTFDKLSDSVAKQAQHCSG